MKKDNRTHSLSQTQKKEIDKNSKVNRDIRIAWLGLMGQSCPLLKLLPPPSSRSRAPNERDNEPIWVGKPGKFGGFFPSFLETLLDTHEWASISGDWVFPSGARSIMMDIRKSLLDCTKRAGSGVRNQNKGKEKNLKQEGLNC